MTASALAVIRLLPAMRMRFGAAAYRVCRSSYGEFYFLLAVVTLFWWTAGQSSLLFTIPVLDPDVSRYSRSVGRLALREVVVRERA